MSAADTLRTIVRTPPAHPTGAQGYARARLDAALALLRHDPADEDALAFVRSMSEGREMSDMVDRVRAAVYLLDHEGAS